MLLLPEKELAHLLRRLTTEQCQQLLHALSDALGTFSAQTVSAAEKLIHQPLRSHIVTRDGDTALFMPVSDTSTTGIKIVAIPAQGGGVQGVINVLSPQGKLMGVLSAAEVTAFRTALATMTLFTRCVSLPKRHILIFGSGRQAEWHARLALLLVPDEIETITFVNRGRKRLEKIEHEVLPELRQRYPKITMRVLAKEDTPDYDTHLRSLLASSDVLFCCTPSTEPLFPYVYLQTTGRQRFISLIGSYKPHMQEVDTETLLSGGGRVYVDSKEACLEESGELIRAGVREEQLVEIGELFAGGKTVTVTPSPGENVVFKCVGMGIMDLVVAKTLLSMAVQGIKFVLSNKNPFPPFGVMFPSFIYCISLPPLLLFSHHSTPSPRITLCFSPYFIRPMQPVHDAQNAITHTHIAMMTIMHLNAGDAEKIVPAVRQRRVPEDEHREDEDGEHVRAQRHHRQGNGQRVLEHMVHGVRVHGAQGHGRREPVVLAVDEPYGTDDEHGALEPVPAQQRQQRHLRADEEDMVDGNDNDAVEHVPRRGLLLGGLQFAFRRPRRPENVDHLIDECGEKQADDLRGDGHEDLDDAGWMAETELGPCLPQDVHINKSPICLI
ncbi:Proline utilization protein PrnX [Rasamsonia emersonii CBS 393.64]|uniref:Proline utilization protein PrnX n=1 Tax=Rasamsonia emersonii (strain ATCC 16479 / CBS 393.64 / IMI 116815) TaxID=1408163 RepID=A0A0F4YRK9_RASE3|nr:Proline utilization protein PrnX [Rasamsonia emersonii CBS 393.64]KKA20927.1 Proline utilization protein PrnX [Rasamsonia emersonii CBS 393.64]